MTVEPAKKFRIIIKTDNIFNGMRAYINENPDRRDKITFLDEPFDINKLSRPFIVNELRLAYLELLERLDIEKEKDTNSIEQKRLYELEKRVEEYLKQ